MGLFIGNLENLKKYKYQGDDRSIVTKYLLKPYWWSNFVKIFPKWVAPNLVTLSGFGFIAVNLITLLFYDPYLNNYDVPSWTIVSYAFGLFMYQTFDACDGMQARKTGQSGPLGELFDHCVDALNTTLSAIIFGSVTKMGYGWTFIIAQFGVLANFYLSTWEEYHTHVLFLSEFSGPVEGILMIIALYLVTAVKGSHIWTNAMFTLHVSQHVPQFLLKPLASVGIVDGTPVDASIVYLVLGMGQLYFNISSAYNNVKQKYHNDKSGNYITQAHIATKGLIPFASYYLTVVIFLLLGSPYVFTNCSTFIPFVLQIGTTMAFTVGKIIISHLTLSEFPYKIPSLFIPAIQIVSFGLVKLLNAVREESLGQISIEKAVNNIVWAGFGVSVGIYGCFIAELVIEIPRYLDIWVLSIKHPKSD